MKSTESCQVAYPSQRDRRVHEGSLEQPQKVCYTEEDLAHKHGTRPLELRQAPSRVRDEGERFVGQNYPRQENGHNVYAHDLESQSRRRSEMVLPSIERDLPNKQGDQTSLHEKTGRVNPFGSYQPPNGGRQQLPAPLIINLDDHEELPSSKRCRIDNQQPVDSHGQGRTILVPIEQIDDRRLRYEQPHEAVYRDDTGHFVSDRRIVPLPPKEERAKHLSGQQELRLFSPRAQMERRPDQVADRGERDPQPRDPYQVPLSHSENVENLQFPSRAVFAPPECYNDSPKSFDSSQFAPKHHESSDLAFSSRHDVSVIADSHRVYADSDGMMRRLPPLGVAERLMPSRFSDMSIDYRQRDDDRRPDRVTYVPSTAATDFHTYTRPTTGALTYFFATAIANVHGHAGYAIHPLTYALDTAKDVSHENVEPSTNTYPHDISERPPASTNLDYPSSRMQQIFGVKQQPVWPVKQNASSYCQPSQQQSENDRASAFRRPALPPALRAAVKPWSDTASSVEFDLANQCLGTPTYSQETHR